MSEVFRNGEKSQKRARAAELTCVVVFGAVAQVLLLLQDELR